MYNYWENRYAFCVRRYDQSSQNHRQKVYTWGGFTFVQAGLILKFVYNLHWFAVFHILIWGLGALSVVAKPTKAMAVLKGALVGHNPPRFLAGPLLAP